MALKNSRLLLIDDTPTALKLLSLMVETMGWQFDTAVDGVDALEKINAQPADYYSVIVSDWMMPKMNGLELLKTLKTDPTRRHIPVIMRTALADNQSIKTGLEAGAFYYLTKPLDMSIVQSVIAAAIKDSSAHFSLRSELGKITRSFGLVKQARFSYKNLDEVRGLSTLIACLACNAEDVVVGLFELMVNAVEHGNLGITYDEKTALIDNERLSEEIAHRLTLDEYRDKAVTVDLNVTGDEVEVTIRDQGNGFDFANYLEFSMERALDNHGRGIMMANHSGFNSMEYLDGGRTVRCVITKSIECGN